MPLSGQRRFRHSLTSWRGIQNVYRALNKLEEARLVASEWEDPDAAVQQKRPRRRYYAISQEGRSTLRDVAERYSVFASIGETDEARV